MKKFGLVWWNTLFAREKETEIEPLLDQGLSSLTIAEKLGLETRNRVITVRARIKIQRKKDGVPMTNWIGKGALKTGKERAPRATTRARQASQDTSDASLYQAGSLRRDYGRPTVVLTRERRERGYQDSDFNIGGHCSPFPAPTKELPFETIAYWVREMYEKPFKNKPTV